MIISSRDARAAALLAALAALPAIGSWWLVHDEAEFRLAVAPVRWVGADEVAGPGSGVVLWLDVREAEAFGAGHLPGAIMVGGMGQDEIAAAIATAWRPGTRVVAYGEPGERTRPRRLAARLTRDLGIGPVAILRGDWRQIRDGASAGGRP